MLLNRRPSFIRREVVVGAAGREDEAVVSLHDLLTATPLEMIKHRLPDGILLALQDPSLGECRWLPHAISSHRVDARR